MRFFVCSSMCYFFIFIVLRLFLSAAMRSFVCSMMYTCVMCVCVCVCVCVYICMCVYVCMYIYNVSFTRTHLLSNVVELEHPRLAQR